MSSNEEKVGNLVDYRSADGYRLSLSGNERNQLFLNEGQGDFHAIATLSGTDHIADGRAFALLDFDRDGQLDFAMVNANNPLFVLLQNRTQATEPEQHPRRNMLAIRLVGGNQTAKPSTDFSNRDGVGANVRITTRSGMQLRERRAGEGFASQNSGLLYFGLGENEVVEELLVDWPSGKQQQWEALPANSLVTIYEDAATAPNDQGIVTEPYLRDIPAPSVGQRPEKKLEPPRCEIGRTIASELRVYVGMASHCESCTRELPTLRRLRSQFSADELEIIGIPADPDDEQADLEAYQAKHDLPYELWTDLSKEQFELFKQRVESKLVYLSYPVFMVTNRQGEILSVRWKPPTVSDLRKLLRAEKH